MDAKKDLLGTSVTYIKVQICILDQTLFQKYKLKKFQKSKKMLIKSNSLHKNVRYNPNNNYKLFCVCFVSLLSYYLLRKKHYLFVIHLVS